MLISIKKTKIMTIYANNSDQHMKPKILIDNQPLENVETFRYLGNYVDSKLTGKKHLANIENKVNHSIALILNLKEYVSKEKILQWTQTFTYPLSYYGWKAMCPLMTPTDQEKWNAITRKVQQLSIDAPPNCSTRILKQICPIRDLVDTRNQFLFKETLTLLTDPTYTNSFMEKIKPVELRTTRQNINANYQIE